MLGTVKVPGERPANKSDLPAKMQKAGPEYCSPNYCDDLLEPKTRNKWTPFKKMNGRKLPTQQNIYIYALADVFIQSNFQ